MSRCRAVALTFAAGASAPQIADLFGISVHTVREYIKRERQVLKVKPGRLSARIDLLLAYERLFSVAR